MESPISDSFFRKMHFKLAEMLTFELMNCRETGFQVKDRPSKIISAHLFSHKYATAKSKYRESQSFLSEKSQNSEASRGRAGRPETIARPK
jgi:hypothetical protein